MDFSTIVLGFVDVKKNTYADFLIWIYRKFFFFLLQWFHLAGLVRANKQSKDWRDIYIFYKHNKILTEMLSLTAQYKESKTPDITVKQ